jgi:hypothetical protein
VRSCLILSRPRLIPQVAVPYHRITVGAEVWSWVAGKGEDEAPMAQQRGVDRGGGWAQLRSLLRSSNQGPGFDRWSSPSSPPGPWSLAPFQASWDLGDLQACRSRRKMALGC